MFVRATLVVMLVLCAAAAAEARVRSLDVIKEPCPQAMLMSPAEVDAPTAPVQATAPRAGCSCQGESDKCACSGQNAESCCCSTKAEDARPVALTLPKRILKRRLAAAKNR